MNINPCNNKQNISFKSLNINMKLGQEVLAAFKKEFPELRSTTELLIDQYGKQSSSGAIQDEIVISEPVLKMAESLIHLREHKKYLAMRSNSHHGYFASLKELLSRFKVGNCQEQTEVIHHSLKAQGQESKVVRFDIFEKDSDFVSGKRPVNDHCFNLVGFEPSAQSDAPDTWGKNAVIIDPLFGIVAKASDAIKHMEHKFGLDKLKEEFVYWFVEKPYL